MDSVPETGMRYMSGLARSGKTDADGRGAVL